MILITWMQDDLGWRPRGNCSLLHWSKGIVRPNHLSRLLPCTSIFFAPLFNIIWDTVISCNDAGRHTCLLACMRYVYMVLDLNLEMIYNGCLLFNLTNKWTIWSFAHWFGKFENLGIPSSSNWILNRSMTVVSVGENLCVIIVIDDSNSIIKAWSKSLEKNYAASSPPSFKTLLDLRILCFTCLNETFLGWKCSPRIGRSNTDTVFLNIMGIWIPNCVQICLYSIVWYVLKTTPC